MTTPNDAPGCAGCELGRRAFLRDAVAAMLALALPTVAVAAGDLLVYPVPPRDGALVDRDHDVILVRWQNAVYAFNLSCPHQNTALRWLERDGRFQCPKHKSKYRPDGTFIEGRATRGMDRFAVRRDGDRVVVETGQLLKQTADATAWESAVLHL